MLEWRGLPTLAPAWEAAGAAAAGSLASSGVAVIFDEVAPEVQVPRLIICAYPATEHPTQAVAQHLIAARERQRKVGPAKLAAVACGSADPPVAQDTVANLLCVDGVTQNRLAFRAEVPNELADFTEELLNTLKATSHLAWPAKRRGLSAETTPDDLEEDLWTY